MKKVEDGEEKGSPTLYAGIARKGILSGNPVLIKSLALAPVLVVTTSLKNGLLLAGVTFIVLAAMGVVSSLLYARLPTFLRAAVLTLIAAAFVTPLFMLSERYFPNVAGSVGIFLPLIAVNGIILQRAENYDSKNRILPSLADGAANGAGFAAVILLLSAIREIIGNGTLYEKALPGLTGFSFNFALLPPGGFLTLACLIAIVQHFKLKKETSENRDAE